MNACPACGGPLGVPRPVATSDPALAGGARASVSYALRRCAICGSGVTVGAAPPEAHEVGAYRAGPPRLHRIAGPILRAFDRRRLALLAPWAPPPADLLDAGAGRGRFVLAAARAGYRAAGIEPSQMRTEAARRARAEVQAVGIAEAQLAAASLDAVTIWHVLEHLDAPEEALRRIRAWLAPGGVLLVGVPNLASWQARIAGGRWYHLDIPRHRIHFTEKGLASLLRACGYEPVAGTHHLTEHNLFGMWQALLSRLTRQPSYLYHLLKRNAPVRSRDLPVTVAGLVLLPVAVVLELMAASARRGGTIAVVARRTG